MSTMSRFRSSSPQSRHPIPAVRHEGTNALGYQVNNFSPRSARNRQHQAQQQPNHPDSQVSDDPPQIPNMNRLSSIHNSPPSAASPISSGALLTPIPNGVRRSSAGFTPSPTTNGETTPQTNGQTQNAPMSPPSPNANGETWSSAIGHATTSGKSGRVIERLMADNDRLKRELKEAQTKADELQQRVQMCQPRIQALEAENGNLSHARDVDQTLLARRDRQVADLKEELENEKQRRQALASRTRELQSERDEAVEDKKREINDMTDQTKRATVHAEILEQSFAQMNQSYQARFQAARKEINNLHAEKKEDRDKLAKLEVVGEQFRQELEHARKINSNLSAQWEELRDAYRISTATMHKETTVETERARKLSTEMDQVVNQMRWVMNLKRNTELDDGTRQE